MKQFKAFLIKEFRHLFRDVRTIAVILGIPVVQLMLFGHVITTEITDAKIGVLDLSGDDITREIIARLEASSYFEVMGSINNMEHAEALFRKGDIREIIVFEQGFGRKLIREGNAEVQIITDASDPNIARIIDTYTRATINDFIKAKFPNRKAGPANVTYRMLYNESLESANMFVPGTIALILMLISALMTSISITREKELGTMEILLVSPLRPVQIILGKVIPYLVLAFINAVVIVAVGYFVFAVPVRGSVVLLFAVCLLFIFLALALGILISTVSKTQQTAMLISMVGLMLPTILLSGFIFPIENMPLPLQWLSLLMPPRWFLEAIKDVMLKGAGMLAIWKECLIMLIMLSAFIMISIRKFQIRLDA